jgi:hypothetical protein
MPHIYYFRYMTPTHRDGLSEEGPGKFLFDSDEEERPSVDVTVLILKIAGLVAGLFLALLTASPKVPGMGSDKWFIILSAISLAAAMAWAAWFETLMYRRTALMGIGAEMGIVVIGILIHVPNPASTPAAGLILGIAGFAGAVVLTVYFLRKRILYPKLEFFLPATAFLCLLAIYSAVM